ncbi:DNA replication and repair protein RecF [Fulvitalea axinellae]|uniref:DNA replication and repair protein RecF n=1 Tax=Fulvitalea axinellae TaxID=1182444 RepID=A0AAU9C6P3_9BACT|nr:DNA replication and repair protein RecF [Fulvitalea axinellae]
MFIENIDLLNFKNYENLTCGFSGGINAILGANGCGKTNLLDAIHYLSVGKSAFNLVDSQNIRHGEPFFMVKGRFRHEEESHEVMCSLKLKEKKIITLDKVPYEKLSEHVGRFPVVLIAPDDSDIIREGSEIRRRFFDSAISQTDIEYLADLIIYGRYLRHRNNLLKQFAEKCYFDKDLLDHYDDKLSALGMAIYAKRQVFAQQFSKTCSDHYRHLSEGNEEVNIRYSSQLSAGDMKAMMFEARANDLRLQRTTVGIHKDDFVFTIDDYPLKKFGSQGQQKSFLVALKLARFEIIRELKGYKPILLLDDIFDKLDDRRISRMMDLVSENAFGQIFVTDARPERTKGLFGEINADINSVNIER